VPSDALRSRSTRWFAAAPGGPYRQPRASTGPRPSIMHAREPGGADTRCGLPALLWPISWAIPFDVSADWACPVCARLLPEQVAAAPSR
jgi:hypothetical protein